MIVDGGLAEEWMGVRAGPRVGGAVTVPGRQVLGTVEEVVAGKSIIWSWREVDCEPSQVTIDLAPAGKGTTVLIVERLLRHITPASAPSLRRVCLRCGLSVVDAHSMTGARCP